MTSNNNISFPLQWRSLPVSVNRKKSIFVVITIIAIGFFAGWYMEDILWGAAAILIFYIGLIRYFMPTYYKADENGISERFIGVERKMSWRFILRTAVSNNYVLLSPYKRQNMMERFRAWSVATGSEETAQFIADFVKQKNNL